MSARQKPAVLFQHDEIVAPPVLRACNDRTFELPPILHIMTAAFFLGFVTVLSLAFSKGMLVSYGVFATFILAFFAVPAIFVSMQPVGDISRALGWDEFMTRGVRTATGRVTGPNAIVLVLLLPFLVFCWAIAIASIAALI